MVDKQIKNEQWLVSELISKIKNGKITKPQFQRKKKWDLLPKKNKNTPNEYAYINFLYEAQNSVHAITFGEEPTTNGVIYSNIDGNNRINAIMHFMDNPFSIYNDRLDKLNKHINNINSDELPKKDKDWLKNTFYNLSYNDIMNFKYNKYFIEKGHKELYDNRLKIHRDDIESYVEEIQNNLKVKNVNNFDQCVKINVNLFQGYNTHELCRTFEDINKYGSILTDTELLACRLHNKTDFTLNDDAFETKLRSFIKQYYLDKSDKEVLKCYQYSQKDKINAHDFIVGFQNQCSQKYDFIEKTEADGMSLFFKLWNIMYDSFDGSFKTINVNDFVEKISDSCEILDETISNIFTSKINDKLFNETCKKKLKTLKKNTLCILLSNIISLKISNAERKDIIKSLEIDLLYHFFINDLKHDKRNQFKMDDLISYEAGGGYISHLCRNILSNEGEPIKKSNKELFERLLESLFEQSACSHEDTDTNKKMDKKPKTRRKLKFFEKTLLFYYYKEKIPTNMLDNDFSIEHIIPFSTQKTEDIDIDHIGNLIPIIDTINCQRGNRHINAYKKTPKGDSFCGFIKDIIPTDNKYNGIVDYTNEKPIIKNRDKYIQMCEKNQKTYLTNMINCLFQ